MRVQFTAKKMQIGDEFQAYAEQKLHKLDRFFGDEADAKIVLSASKNIVTLELTVRHDNLIFRAEQSAEEKNEALDSCIDRIIRQIRKNKTKVEKRLRTSAFSENFGDTIEDQQDFRVIKKKEFELRPMNVEEAILQMNMLGHQFFMFKNGDSGETNVVYKREDGNYAVLQPRR